ncbi:hypothetical protein HNR26_004775 [Rhizobium rosettiformans]|uniref:Uncharacterized protein n=2 Tax=Rhizobium rosettiformans TaxID=1368430 RepID=A0A4S8PK28_9HYPH|nr:hypothetical protein [Rhizobium rosettiformans]MBB5278673.1 hypothetical protein [Rhizobium rosettiformans]THV29942.1 hypothetical protein FAA86_23055 [Rhizobium rosettiformans W3]
MSNVINLALRRRTLNPLPLPADFAVGDMGAFEDSRIVATDVSKMPVSFTGVFIHPDLTRCRIVEECDPSKVTFLCRADERQEWNRANGIK